MDTNEILHRAGDTFLFVNRNDLLDFARAYANNVQAPQAKEIVSQEVERPISQKEAIKFLGKSRQTLISWRNKGIIEGHTLGGRVYYLKSELLAALYKKRG